MTKKDLLKYYNEEKNLCNEITLMSHLGIERTFRKYIELYTGKDLWLSTHDGIIFTTDQIVDLYHVPKKIFHVFNDLKIGDVIVTYDEDNDKEYYKKIDDDVFIECDSEGHINISVFLKQYFAYTSEELTDASCIIKRCEVIE